MASIWLEEAMATEGRPAAQPLEADLKVDIAIVGGGYTGLWTALELKARQPALDICIIEKDVCGAGGSGANAGYALGLWMQFETIAHLAGHDEALRLCRASDAAIAEIESFSATHGIATAVEHPGVIWGATCAMQSDHWHGMIEAAGDHQVRHYTLLDGQEIAGLTGSRAFVGGVLDRSAALIHPGHLVRGLRRVALDRGVRIFEATPMTRLQRGRPPRVVTPHGTVTAGKVILALYGWTLGVRELRSGVMVICTDLVMSRPIPDRLAELGWRGGPALSDSRIFVEAYRVTADGRLLWSKAGGAMPFGARVDACLTRPYRSLAEMRTILRAVQPSLAEIPVAGMWNGPIDRSRSGLPMFGRLPGSPDILYGYGYSGAGIVFSKLGARMLASLALDTDDSWSASGLVRPPEHGFPPEPFRFVGGRMVRAAIARKDRLDHEDRATGPITNTLLKFKPASYKPT